MTIEESNLHEAIEQLYSGMPLLPLPTADTLPTRGCPFPQGDYDFRICFEGDGKCFLEFKMKGEK